MTTSLRNTKIVGRLAPSPSGEMHLGNAFTYILAWCATRKLDGSVLFRMEDIDERCRKDKYKEQVIEDMRLLGLNWDGEINYQSHRTHIYDEIFNCLKGLNLVYPCFCTRADLHTASAPHASDGTFVYSGKCKHLSTHEIHERSMLKQPAYRIKVPDATICIADEICGEFSQNLKTECGDFVIKRSDGIYSYQFAVAVDDYLQGVNQIVRGNDLLSSSIRQVYLRNLIERITTRSNEYQAGTEKVNKVAKEMQFAHVPLLTDKSGRRLAKRDKDLTIRFLKENGVTTEQIIGYFAYILKFIDRPAQISITDFLNMFHITKIENQNIVVNYDHIASLR